MHACHSLSLPSCPDNKHTYINMDIINKEAPSIIPLAEEAPSNTPLDQEALCSILCEGGGKWSVDLEHVWIVFHKDYTGLVCIPSIISPIKYVLTFRSSYLPVVDFTFLFLPTSSGSVRGPLSNLWTLSKHKHCKSHKAHIFSASFISKSFFGIAPLPEYY